MCWEARSDADARLDKVDVEAVVGARERGHVVFTLVALLVTVHDFSLEQDQVRGELLVDCLFVARLFVLALEGSWVADGLDGLLILAGCGVVWERLPEVGLLFFEPRLPLGRIGVAGDRQGQRRRPDVRHQAPSHRVGRRALLVEFLVFVEGRLRNTLGGRLGVDRASVRVVAGHVVDVGGEDVGEGALGREVPTAGHG